MSEFFTGEIANAKVGRNLVKVEIIEDCGNGNYKVKSVSSGREFNTSRLEKINNNHQMEEAIMPEDTLLLFLTFFKYGIKQMQFFLPT